MHKFYNKSFEITDANALHYAEQMAEFVCTILRNASKKGVVLGLSGGLDSSVVAALCVTYGINIRAIMLPDGDSMSIADSLAHAGLICKTYNIKEELIDISVPCAGIQSAVGNISEAAGINIRPRIRTAYLYAIAQSDDLLVIGTSNLSERVLGYFTKFGDSACDLNPLGMLTKREVRSLARALKVPKEIIAKPPSAALRAGQTDEEDIGVTYDQIDDFIIFRTSGSESADKRILALMNANLHKNLPVPIFEG